MAVLPSTSPGARSAAQDRARVQWDTERNEPYILIPGFPSVRLTPMKASDAEGITELCNDPQVGKYAYRRPYPFKLEDAQWFLDEFLPDIQKTAAAIKVHLENGTRPPPVAFAMQAMRYIPARAQRPTSTLTPTTPSGSAAAEPPLDPLADLGLTPGAFLGNFHSFPTDPDPIAKPQMDDEMAAKGGAVHDVAYDLMPSVWGRGLGLRGVKAMLEAWDEWAGVEMGVANVEETNAASLALVRKCGFVHVDTMRWEWPMEKGGGERTVLRHEWRNPSSKR